MDRTAVSGTAGTGSIPVGGAKIRGQNDSTHPEANDFKAFGFLSGGISICLNMARI